MHAWFAFWRAGNSGSRAKQEAGVAVEESRPQVRERSRSRRLYRIRLSRGKTTAAEGPFAAELSRSPTLSAPLGLSPRAQPDYSPVGKVRQRDKQRDGDDRRKAPHRRTHPFGRRSPHSNSAREHGEGKRNRPKKDQRRPHRQIPQPRDQIVRAQDESEHERSHAQHR